MTHEYDEEEKRARSIHPPSTVAGTSSMVARSASPTQLPVWTQDARSRVRDEEQALRQWLNKHVEELGHQSLTLPQLVQNVLDSVPGAVKLSRVQVETIMCEWAAERNITVLRTVPQPTGHGSIAKGKPDEKGQKKKDLKGK